jgi:hypothetical protein
MRDFNIKNTINKWKIKIYYSLVIIDKDILNFHSPALDLFALFVVTTGEVTIFVPHFWRK